MKYGKLTLFFFSATLVAGSSFAGYAIDCNRPKNHTEAYWCAYIGNNKNQGNSKFKGYLPNGAYCVNQFGHIEGWSFILNQSENNGSLMRVSKINSHAGMPNPNTKFSLFWGSLPGVFFIREQQTINNTIIKDYGPFKWISSDAFSDNFNIYSIGQCR